MKNARITRFATLFAVLLTTSSVAAQVVAQKKKTAVPKESVNAAVQPFVDSGEVAGVVTLVGHKGKIIHLGAVGQSNIEKGRDMKPFNTFAIASMTKPITATAVMILQDEGKLSVDDEVKKYLPSFAELKLKDGLPAARPITIRDCLTHTAGLAGDQIFPGTLAEGMEELSTRPLAFQPGERWQYSPGVSVAGRIVEVVSGQSFADFLSQRIFQPLGMNSTTFRPDEKLQRRLATLYTRGDDGKLQPTDNFIGSLSDVKGDNPSAGLVSSARDLFRFYQMVLNGGKLRGKRILSADAVRQMTSPQTGGLKTGFTPGNAWGLGWCVVQQPQGVTEMLSVGTFGHGGAFGTQGWVDPQTETIYVLLIQRANFGNGDASDLRKQFQLAANEATGG